MAGRFVKKYSQGTVSVMEIWVDTETGVNYLFRQSGNSGGLTVMLDSSGKPVVETNSPGFDFPDTERGN